MNSGQLPGLGELDAFYDESCRNGYVPMIWSHETIVLGRISDFIWIFNLKIKWNESLEYHSNGNKSLDCHNNGNFTTQASERH